MNCVFTVFCGHYQLESYPEMSTLPLGDVFKNTVHVQDWLKCRFSFTSCKITHRVTVLYRGAHTNMEEFIPQSQCWLLSLPMCLYRPIAWNQLSCSFG